MAVDIAAGVNTERHRGMLDLDVELSQDAASRPSGSPPTPGRLSTLSSSDTLHHRRDLRNRVRSFENVQHERTLANGGFRGFEVREEAPCGVPPSCEAAVAHPVVGRPRRS